MVWTSSNEEVATVSDTGYVEICGVGTAVITVTAGNVKAVCKITVPQLIDWIEFDEDEIELKAGQTYQLKPYISPSDATNKNSNILLLIRKWQRFLQADLSLQNRRVKQNPGCGNGRQ